MNAQPSITGRTAVIAVIADPVEQARSPTLVNAALAQAGRDAVMIPMHVALDGLAPVIGGLRRVQNFRGAVVSMPHKIALVDLLDEVTPEVREVGACNVVRRGQDGRLVGANFDGEGFVLGLRSGGHEVRGRRVFLAGAGGAASAIAFAVARHGAAALTIHNRTAARAAALVERVQTACPALDVRTGDSRPDGHDLVINATSLGMRAGDALPCDVSALGPGTIAAEIVVHPETTPFLAAAAQRGCTLHYGGPMLAAQLELMIHFMLDGGPR